MNSQDPSISVHFGGDTSGLEQASGKATSLIGRFADSVRGAADKTKAGWSQVSGAFEGVARSIGQELGSTATAHLGAFGGVAATVARETAEHWDKLPTAFKAAATAAGLAAIGIGAAFAGKKFADATAEAIEGTRDFARAMGITTNEARVYQAALADVGASEGEFTGLARGMTRQLKEHEEDMKKMGLATRDASGHFRPLTELVTEGIQVLGKYAEGTERNMAATVLFGRSADATSRVLLMNKEAVEENRKAVKELGLEVGESSVAAWADYDRASDRASLTLKAFGKAIGDSVMPVVTELTDWFNSIAPAAITVLRGALSGLSTAFLGLTNGIVILWETFKAVIFTLTDPIVRLGTALTQLASGNVKGATQTMMGMTDAIGARWGMMWDEVSASSQRTADRVKRMWAFATGGEGAPGSGGGLGPGGNGKPPTKGDTKEEKPAESFMGYYEALLSEEKSVQATLSQGRAYSKQEELAFWQFVLQTAQVTQKDKISILRKTNELETAIEREHAAQKKALSEVDIEHASRMGELELQAARAAAQASLQLGTMTHDQMVQAELQFEDRRFQIRQQAIGRRLALLDPESDPVLYRQLKAQIEEAEAEHQLKLAEIRNNAQLQSAERTAAVWADASSRVSSLWDQGVEAMMNGTFRWSNAMKAIGAQVVGWFTNAVIKPMVMQWIFGESAKTGATAAGTASRTAMELLASAKSVAIWAATAVKNIMSSAWEAMAGAYKAIVGIPYVGPFLAPAMAAAAFVGVSRLASNVMSAENGYDIPAGVDPLVQAHAKEMVLPAKYADVIRDAADDGGLMGGGGSPSVDLRAQPVGGNMFLVMRDDLVAAMNTLVRQGALRYQR